MGNLPSFYIQEVNDTQKIYQEIEVFLQGIQNTSQRVSYLLSQLDFSEFANNDLASKFTLISIIKLYLFRLIKGIKNYERLLIYLNEHENEAFELGFFKDENNKIELPPKRTFNNYLKNNLTSEQKQELNSIAEKILIFANKNNVILDLEIVKKAIQEKIEKFKLTETDMRDTTKLAKKLFYSDLNVYIGKTGKYKPKDIYDVMSFLSFKNCFANNGTVVFRDFYPDKPAPSGDTLLYHCNKLPPSYELLKTVEKISNNIFNYARKNYNVLNNSRKLDIAFDIHDLDYYGKHANYVCGGKQEHGTTNFFKFLTCSIVIPNYRFIVDVVPIPPMYPIEKLLDESLNRVKNKIRINTAYLDRGFNSIDIINVLKKNNIKFLMPCTRWDTVKDYMDKDRENVRDALVYENFKIGNKTKSAIVNLVFVKAENGEKHAFICNFPVAEPLAFHLYEWYSQRWGIETCYRVLDKNLRPRTTSNNYNIRLFYFLFSCCLYNLWVLINISASLTLYGRIRAKPIISVDRFISKMFSIFIEYYDDDG